MDLLSKTKQLQNNPALLLECFFYEYAHNLDNKVKEASLVKIKDLIISGVRSPNFNLQDNVARATKDGHPHPKFLATLAKVISEESDASELDQYGEWTKQN